MTWRRHSGEGPRSRSGPRPRRRGGDGAGGARAARRAWPVERASLRAHPQFDPAALSLQFRARAGLWAWYGAGGVGAVVGGGLVAVAGGIPADHRGMGVADRATDGRCRRTIGRALMRAG